LRCKHCRAALPRDRSKALSLSRPEYRRDQREANIAVSIQHRCRDRDVSAQVAACQFVVRIRSLAQLPNRRIRFKRSAAVSGACHLACKCRLDALGRSSLRLTGASRETPVFLRLNCPISAPRGALQRLSMSSPILGQPNGRFGHWCTSIPLDTPLERLISQADFPRATHSLLS
jgi:hypothetical protein